MDSIRIAAGAPPRKGRRIGFRTLGERAAAALAHDAALHALHLGHRPAVLPSPQGVRLLEARRRRQRERARLTRLITDIFNARAAGVGR